MGHELVVQARTIVESAANLGVTARALGGLGVALRCPSAVSEPFARRYSDIDLATTRRHASRLAEVLAPLGFEPARRFNAINGQTRLLFGAGGGLHVDVFVDRFRMCHELRFTDRIEVNGLTLPLAELLLTKVQVAELTAKDVKDISVLLLDHDLREDDDGINASYIAGILARDWGWWRTTTENLLRVGEQVELLPLDNARRARIAAALDELSGIIGARRKSPRWKARAAVGERMTWREEPEDARR